MLRANSRIEYNGSTWYPGQEIRDIPEALAERLLFTGEAVGTMPEPKAEQNTPVQPESDLQQYTIGELRKIAKERGAAVPKNATKAELIGILEGGRQ